MKKAVTTQTIFLIMMLLIMIGLIVFGYTRIVEVSDTLSETQYLEIQNSIRDVMEYCDNPLNRGSVRTEIFESEKFNAICIIEEDPPEIIEDIEGVKDILQTDNNIILFNVGYINNDGELEDVSIVDSMSTYATRTQCWFSENSDELVVELTC